MNFDKQEIKVPYPLIEWAVRTDNVRNLAAWLILKRQYQFGHLHSIKSCYKFSRNTASKYIQRLLNIGLIVPDPVFGYQCISIKKACVLIAGYKKKFAIIHLKNTTTNDLIKQLRAMVVKSHIVRQEVAAKEKATALTGKLPLKTKTGLAQNAITLSDFKCGRYFFMSYSTGRRLKQWMKKQKIISLRNQLPIQVCEGNFRQEKFLRDTINTDKIYFKVFYKNGFLWKMQAQVVEVLSMKYNPFHHPLTTPYKINTK